MKRYVTRSIVWSLTFYALIIFAVYYLKNKAQIKGSESFLIFIPLLLLGISSESFSKLLSRRLRILGASDFCCKAAAFVLLVLPFPVPSANRFWILRLVFICVLLASSTIIEMLSLKFYDKYKDEVLNEKQPDKYTLSFKELGRLNVFSGLGTFCPLWGGFTVLFFGYTPAFFIIGIPLLVVGIGSLIYRTVVLIKNGKEFASLFKIIIDDLLTAAVIIISIAFTSAEIVDTETGFTIRHNGYILETLGYAVLYIFTLALHSHTNRKIASAYFKRRNKIQNDELF